MKVKQIYFDNNEIVIISMEEAIEKLRGYWKETEIQKMLLEEQKLWSPFAEFSLLTELETE